MALLRNKVTGELIKCTYAEARICSCPATFKSMVEEHMLKTGYLGSLSSLRTYPKGIYYKMSQAEVAISDILNENLEEIPDNEVSQVLYGKRNSNT